jgi:HD-GYP domain-containing protein (c-di-GMP phosphodiesterase class II)
MRFSTRIFLGAFLPFTVLLAASFWVINLAATETIRDGLRRAVRDNHDVLARFEARSHDREVRILEGVAQNPTLKAGLEVLTNEHRVPEQARNTVRDQLTEIADSLKFDLVVVYSLRGDPLAGVLRGPRGFTPIDLTHSQPQGGFFRAGDQVYEVTSVPVFEASAQVASLSVGERLEMGRFAVPAVLLRQGIAISAHATGMTPLQIGSALRDCPSSSECQVTIHGQLFLSAPLDTASTEGIYQIRSLQNADAAGSGFEALLRRIFFIAGLAALVAALGISVAASRTIARPLSAIAAKLREFSRTGDLPELDTLRGGPREIVDLGRGFNQAAQAVREGRGHLTRAYVEFVGSLAQALDARDSYTAGHSRRVSDYACTIATTLALSVEDLETIRIGALLHDLGKIGISDLVLQKPGRLTPEENEVIRRHPVIGRRILQDVHGFEPYLPIIELHHENWDGSGYPYGLKGEAIPLHARIVKVADAYDAMTSDRPYRRGMAHSDAIAILRRISGSEADPVVVEAFAQAGTPAGRALTPDRSLIRLADAVQAEAAIRVEVDS